MKVKNDHRSKFSSLSNWERRSLKKSGLQRDSNPWPLQIPVRYEATHWERGQFLEFMSPVRSEMMWSRYEIIHIWTAIVDESKEWSSLKPWVFRASFQLLILQNLLRRSFFILTHYRRIRSHHGLGIHLDGHVYGNPMRNIFHSRLTTYQKIPLVQPQSLI